ncbi:MAG: hypothetical protein Q8L14_38760 [Myxococcales bacterium]|nr:hypothetical protein [Myxococcales bacterium]
MASVHDLFDVSVLFEDPGMAERAFRGVFKAAPVDAPVTFGELVVLSGISAQSLPAADLDLRHEPGLSLGAASVGLKLGMVDAFTSRTVRGPQDQLASPNGRMREASRLVLALLDHGGHAVVLHKAVGLVRSARSFRNLLGDPNDPLTRPFAAWLDLIATTENDAFVCRSFGMPHSFGRPNVTAQATAPATDVFTLERTMQAVQFVAGRLAADPSIDVPPAHFDVPVRYRLGARAPVAPTAHETVFRWNARLDDDGLMLALTCPELASRHPARLFDEAPERVPFDVYQRLMEELVTRRFAGDGFRDLDGAVYEAGNGLPMVGLQVFSRDDGVFLVATQGVGRQRALSGTAQQATEHAEFFVVTRSDAAPVRNALLGLAALALTTTAPGGLKDYDGFPPSPNGPGGSGLVVMPMNDLPVGGQRPLAFRMFVPVTADEYAVFRGLDFEGRKAWCAQHVASWSLAADRWRA